MDTKSDYIATDLYDHYIEEYKLLTTEELEEEGPQLSREEYYEYKSRPVDYFWYWDTSIRPCLEGTRLYKMDAHSRKWPELLELVRSTEPESWSHKYYETCPHTRILDGSKWSLEVQIDGKQYIAEGCNAWPDELHCLEGGDLRSDIHDLLEKHVDPYGLFSDSESIKQENEVPEVKRPSTDESEEVETKPRTIPKAWRPSTFSKPLIKRPDVIFFKDKRYVLLSDPIGHCVINGRLVAYPDRYYGSLLTYTEEYRGRGYNAEWIIQGNQLKISRFSGNTHICTSLEEELYLRFYDVRRGVHLIKSRYEWCRRFAIFSGELKLYDYEQMMCTSKLGWLLGPKDNITLTVKAGEVVQERASKTYCRPNPFINLTGSYAVSWEDMFAKIVGYIFALFLPLWIKICISWPLDGLYNLCFYAFQVYWIYCSLKTLHGGKPGWL